MQHRLLPHSLNVPGFISSCSFLPSEKVEELRHVINRTTDAQHILSSSGTTTYEVICKYISSSDIHHRSIFITAKNQPHKYHVIVNRLASGGQSIVKKIRHQGGGVKSGP